MATDAARACPWRRLGRLISTSPADGARLRARRGRAAGVQPGHDDGDWIAVPVPGDVHRALIEAGRIAHPFYDRNEDDCAWMEEREWWYRVALRRPARSRRPTSACGSSSTAWTRTPRCGSTATSSAGTHNMFRPAGLRRHRHCARRANALAIRFDPPLARTPARHSAPVGRNPERVCDAQGAVRLRLGLGPAAADDRHLAPGRAAPRAPRRARRRALATARLAPDRGRALVAVRVEAERFAGDGAADRRASSLTAPGGPAHEASVALERRRASAYLSVDQPRLWWTHDLGEPALYDLASRC